MQADQVPKTDDMIQTPEDLDHIIGCLETNLLLYTTIFLSLKGDLFWFLLC